MEIVSIIDVEDAAAIQSKIKECIEKDPGAFEEEAMVIKVEEGGGEEEEGEAIPPVTPETALIDARMRNIQTQVKSIGSLQRISAGMYSGKVQGIMIGLVFILTLGTILLLQ
jgi:tetrahydromethanopterin S-methyltransferase subunit A